jgi:hypothetical protein
LQICKYLYTQLMDFDQVIFHIQSKCYFRCTSSYGETLGHILELVVFILAVLKHGNAIYEGYNT